MAEAALDSNSRYFCHTCNNVINPVLPEFVCPSCAGGFVELLSPEEETVGSGSTTNTRTEGPSMGSLEADGPQLFDMFQIINNFVGEGIHNPPDGPMANNPTRPRGNGNPPGSHGGQRSNAQVHMPRTSITFQNVGTQPIALMDLFNSLPAAPGGGNILFPFQMFNLHGNPQDYVWGEGGLDTIITQLLNNVEGQGPPPASKDDIDKLKTITLTDDNIGAASDSNECPVCKDDFARGDEVKKLPCDHIFHPDCVITWLKMHNTCPVCRRAVGETENMRQHADNTDPPFFDAL